MVVVVIFRYCLKTGPILTSPVCLGNGGGGWGGGGAGGGKGSRGQGGRYRGMVI